MKGRASKVSCSSQKVGGNTWRPFWRSVKNAQFHPTKHLSRWVPKIEAEQYSTPSIFLAHRHFQLFCSLWPSYLRNDQYNVPTGTRRSAVKKNETGRIFGQKGTPSRKWIFAEISASFWQLTIGMLWHRPGGHFWGSWATGNKKVENVGEPKNRRCRVPFSL